MRFNEGGSSGYSLDASGAGYARQVVIGDKTVNAEPVGHGQSGSGTSSEPHRAQYNYRVRSTDYDADGVSLLGSLTRDTGFRGPGGVSFNNHLLAAGPFIDAKVDGTAGPAVREFRFVSSPGRGDTYGLGEVVEVEAVFDRPMFLQGGAPVLGLAINGWKEAAYARGTGSDRIVFAYTVGAGAVDTDGAGVFTDGIRGGHTLEDRNDRTIPLGPEYAGSPNMAPQSPGADGGGGHKVDDRPRLLSLSLSSDPGADAIYEVGEPVEVTAAFSTAVDVTGTPSIGLEVGSTGATRPTSAAAAPSSWCSATCRRSGTPTTTAWRSSTTRSACQAARSPRRATPRSAPAWARRSRRATRGPSPTRSTRSGASRTTPSCRRWR